MKYYFTKGVNRVYPKRWYLSAHPQAQVVQYFSRTDVSMVKLYIENLGFKPAKRYDTYVYYDQMQALYSGQSAKRTDRDLRNLFIVFKNKSDEAHFIMLTADGFGI